METNRHSWKNSHLLAGDYPIFFVEWYLMKIRWMKYWMKCKNLKWQMFWQVFDSFTTINVSVCLFKYKQKIFSTQSQVIRKAKIITASKGGLLLLRAILFNLFSRKKIAGPHFHSLWSGDTLMYLNEKA